MAVSKFDPQADFKTWPAEVQRMFRVVFSVAMEAGAPPIRSAETRIDRRTAEEARQLLKDLGYDFEAAYKLYLKTDAANRQRAYDQHLAEKR
jgi:hypothetical protein